MSFFGKGNKTPQQKAQWAKTRLMLRGAALVYLVVFIIVPMINPETDDIDAMNPMLRYAIIAFFIIASGGLLIVTVLDYIKAKNKGLFEPETYKDEETAEVVSTEDDEYNDEDDD